ncbi:MAG: putative porin [Caulobacteraceae bacterium]|nr:putative porin [Caulobacteraceae bacterium]
MKDIPNVSSRPGRRRPRILSPWPDWAALCCALLFATPAAAQVVSTAHADGAPSGAAPTVAADTAGEVPAAPASAAQAAAEPSEAVALNLVRLLVKQGVISQAAADDLIREAEAQTRQARQASAEPPAPPPGVIRVPYVPEVVRNQIRDDIKRDVLAEAQSEGWANPHVLPSWLDHVHWFGDFRIQDQFNFYSPNNISPFIDYATFNANGPIDVNASTNPNGLPFLNTRRNRLNQFLLRARFGVSFDVADGVSMTFRLASGSNNGPVSTTQILGGGFTKKDVWLDQAYITLAREGLGSINFGRSPDYFMHTDLVLSDSLNLDGVEATAEHAFGDRLSLFGAAGAFPVGYVGSGFPTNQADKANDHTKWLFAGQAGLQYGERPSWSLRGAVSYYDFYNMKGQLSAPCDLFTGITQCSTDWSRPDYMQKGNTLFLLRNITPNPNSPFNFAQPQFVGLSYDYRLMNATIKVEFPLFGDVRGQLVGDYVRNLAYDPKRILSNPLTQPVTNFGVTASGGVGSYRSGPTGWMAGLVFGHLDPSNAGDWTLSLGYKYIEPDAVVDAFNDYDFHLGGTNAKGYFITGAYYVAHNTWLDFRWYSANEVFGPPLAIDVLWLEMNTRF